MANALAQRRAQRGVHLQLLLDPDVPGAKASAPPSSALHEGVRRHRYPLAGTGASKLREAALCAGAAHRNDVWIENGLGQFDASRSRTTSISPRASSCTCWSQLSGPRRIRSIRQGMGRRRTLRPARRCLTRRLLAIPHLEEATGVGMLQATHLPPPGLNARPSSLSVRVVSVTISAGAPHLPRTFEGVDDSRQAIVGGGLEIRPAPAVAAECLSVARALPAAP